MSEQILTEMTPAEASALTEAARKNPLAAVAAILAVLVARRHERGYNHTAIKSMILGGFSDEAVSDAVQAILRDVISAMLEVIPPPSALIATPVAHADENAHVHTAAPQRRRPNSKPKSSKRMHPGPRPKIMRKRKRSNP